MNNKQIADKVMVHVNTVSKYKSIFKGHIEALPEDQQQDFLVKTLEHCKKFNIKPYAYLRQLNGIEPKTKTEDTEKKASGGGIMSEIKKEAAALRIEMADLSDDIYTEQTALQNQNAELVQRVNQLDGLLSIALKKIAILEEKTAMVDVDKKLDRILEAIEERETEQPKLADWKEEDTEAAK